MKTLTLLAQGIFLLLLCAPASALTTPEKFVYEVTWKGMKVGSAVQTVTEQGERVIIENTLTSSAMLSAMFRIDDKTESVIYREARDGRPGIYRENIREGRYRARKEARFDFRRLAVNSTDYLKKTEKSDPITAKTYDSLSSIYFVRNSELVPGQTISFDLYDFKRLWKTEVRVVKREEIRTPLGRFKTLVVTTELKSNGATAKVGNGTFWFTDDSRRIPVKIKTKIKMGEVTLTLVEGAHKG